MAPAAAVRRSGLHVSSLCRGGFFTHAQPGARRATLADNLIAVEEAAALEADVLILASGGLVAGTRDIVLARRMIADAISRCPGADRRLGPPDASSELGELGERSRDPGLLRAEVDEDGDIVLDADNPAEAVAVVRHLVVHRVLLNRLGRGTIIEGTAGQITPGEGAGRVHHFYYAALRLHIAPGMTNRR